MRVRLLKSHIIFSGKKLPKGTVVSLDYGHKLVKSGDAEEYHGKMPPPKLKTNFRNKDIKENGNSIKTEDN